MSTSILLSNNLTLFKCNSNPRIHQERIELKRYSSIHRDISWRKQNQNRNPRVLGLVVPKAKRSSWWRRFFLEEEGNWLGLREGDLESDEVEDNDDGKFEAWRKRAEAIIELREAQEGARNEENRSWEDWLDYDLSSGNGGVIRDWEGNERMNELSDDDDVVVGDANALIGAEGLVRSVKDLVLGRDDDNDDLLYEDRVFRYASRNSAKFLAILIIIPWAMDFLVHDYVFMPFLDRYVKTVPLAAEILDVRRNQKLQMVKELKTEKARLQFEMEIGKSPPLSDDEMWWELRHKALDMREEWRLENRKAFANIFSDAIFGISLFVLLYFNQSKVALLKFTGYKIINNISDTGKAFLIILITDIFLGYHSESGWQTVCEIIVEHYGLEVDQSVITIFICLVPVIMDACVKLWLFKFLPRLSPKVSNIFQEMKRH